VLLLVLVRTSRPGKVDHESTHSVAPADVRHHESAIARYSVMIDSASARKTSSVLANFASWFALLAMFASNFRVANIQVAFVLVGFYSCAPEGREAGGDLGVVVPTATFRSLSVNQDTVGTSRDGTSY
jgi:hypothetical protein